MGIATFLTPREKYSPQEAGGIALCVYDFTRLSCFRKDITIIGSYPDSGLPQTHFFHSSIQKRFFWQRTLNLFYTNTLPLLKTAQLVEIHNQYRGVELLQKKCPELAHRVTLHLHNTPKTLFNTLYPPHIKKKITQKCAGILCVSNFIAQQWRKGLPENLCTKVRVLYNGLHIPNQEDLPPKEKYILFVGRILQKKGIEPLSQALARLLPDYPDWKFIVVGSTRHQTSMQPTSFEQRIQKILSPLGNQVEWKGYLSPQETLEYFSKSQIAVIPSLWEEPFGRTALEAMAHKCATVNSRYGGLQEVTGEATLSLDVITPETLCNALKKLIVDEEYRQEVALKGYQRAFQFSISSIVNQLDSLRSIYLSKTEKESIPLKQGI